MGKGSSKFLKLVALIGALPFAYGCGSGGGISSLASFLFDSTVGGFTSFSEVVKDTTIGGGITTFTNPEPASMLLLGGGLAAMTYFSRRNKK